MTGKTPSATAKDVERILKKLGFVKDRQSGSHRVYVRASDNRTVVVPWHTGDLKRGTLGAIAKATGLSMDAFLALK